LQKFEFPLRASFLIVGVLLHPLGNSEMHRQWIVGESLRRSQEKLIGRKVPSSNYPSHPTEKMTPPNDAGGATQAVKRGKMPFNSCIGMDKFHDAGPNANRDCAARPSAG
jgi:hypothetical protein